MSDQPLFGKHISALDGVRGLAVLLVMLFHMTVLTPKCGLDRFWQSLTGHGNIGVDIFFVLSGYLITGILYDSRHSGSYFRSFYARRILRIFPLYYAMVFASFVLLPRLSTTIAAKAVRFQSDQIWYWFHLSNFAVARAGKFQNGLIGVAWTLAIEEQFYLVWPLAVRFLTRKRLMMLSILLFVFPIIARFVSFQMGISPVTIYTVTFYRTDGLAMGAFIALLTRSPIAQSPRTAHAIMAVAAAATIAIFLLGDHGWRLTSGVLNSSAISALAAATIYALVITPRSVALGKIFEIGWLRSFGQYSYALYLFHYPIMGELRDRFFPNGECRAILGSNLPLQAFFYLLAIGASFIAAMISWRFYESQFLKLKKYFPMDTRAKDPSPEFPPAAVPLG